MTAVGASVGTAGKKAKYKLILVVKSVRGNQTQSISSVVQTLSSHSYNFAERSRAELILR